MIEVGEHREVDESQRSIARGRLPSDEVLPSDRHWGMDEYDVATQGLISHHFDKAEDGRWELSSIPFRYVWPAELDLMADQAGMRLFERWEWWRREPFTNESRKHVSVWELPGPELSPLR